MVTVDSSIITAYDSSTWVSLSQSSALMVTGESSMVVSTGTVVKVTLKRVTSRARVVAIEIEYNLFDVVLHIEKLTTLCESVISYRHR